MQAPGSNPYLKTQILTASPEELRLMLFDGAIKYCRQGHMALEQDDYEASYNGLMRAQKIVLELSTSLNHEADPALCEKLSALYTFIYRLLVDANVERDSTPIEEAIRLLQYERETWQMLIDKVAQERNGAKPVASNVVSAQQTAMSSLSVNG